MTTTSTDLLEIVLRECAATAPQPLYPAVYAQATGVERVALDDALDQLRLAGLIRLTDWVPQNGQGYTITPDGSEILANPRLLQRLRTRGAAAVPVPALAPPARERSEPTTWSRGEAVRDALINPARPIVTQLLILANLLVFFAGMIRATQLGLVNEFLGSGQEERIEIQKDGTPRPTAGSIRHETGALNPTDLSGKSQWWRLLSYAFVHIGAMHLLMNMVCLYSIGPLVENLFGSVRYLVLYLISGVGGAGLQLLVDREVGLAGASGCLCGLLTSMLVWSVLNRPYLPAHFPPLNLIVFNLILVTAISFLPNVSWSCHLGGGLAGLVVAVPLVNHRFGSNTQRWLALVGMLLVALLFLFLVWFYLPRGLNAAQATDLINEVLKKDEWAHQLDDQQCRRLIRKLPGDRWDDPDGVIVNQLTMARDDFQQFAAKLAAAGPCRNEDYTKGLEAAQGYLESLARVYDLLIRCVSDNKRWTGVDEAELQKEVEEVRRLRELWHSSPFLKRRVIGKEPR